ncbi:Hypothetical protein R9X50_00157400 [Acrodontium crateriforme]|uniref:Yeast cell wall synthesis Kre9/Knh1-like N-terminal domain-containing protein n=1 Tax=Acrodontium crateriforme TaxID=150365 RepID=A0AAQ3LZQ4_9PEZI|nr:Hypothetical protein R9X50_00157400 [Acrodontium crateriforme]
MLSFTRSVVASALLLTVPFVAAYTHPTGDAPVGNPIYTPNLGTIVPAGQEYNVTWGPTTSGKIDIVLLKGPSSNAVPQYALAEGIDNTGSFLWTPKTDLQPQDTGYGLMIVVDATGQYQYSPQFGISNSKYVSSGTASASSTSSAQATSSKSSASTTSSVASSVSSVAYSSSSTTAIETSKYTTSSPSSSSTESSSAASSMVTSAKPTNATASSTTSSGSAQVTKNSASGLVANTFVVAAVAGALGLAF